MRRADTIVAIATPAGRGAIGVVRVSGPAVPHIAVQLLGSLPAPRAAELRDFRGADGATIDQGLALHFPAPHSFTGEHVLELQGHGGPVVLDAVVHRLLELGCRAATPGEFSERAFLNGKMDMTQAEAVADLIDAGSSAAARAAVRSLQGEFAAHIAKLQGQLTELRVHVEAAIDFPDEEINFLDSPELQRRQDSLFAAFDALLAAARQGALLREGLTVVLAGKPNAGKSSLMNRLAGEDVAIVTPQPGTTRDVLRRDLLLDGLPLRLVDTAGLRPARDPVEAEGIRRAEAELRRADRILYVIDASDADLAAALEPTGPLAGLAPGLPVTLLFNKIDLPAAVRSAAPALAAGRDALWVSAETGEGLAALREHLKAAAGYHGPEQGALSARRRHLDALRRARLEVDAAAVVLHRSRATELFAEHLRLAQRALGEITGEFTSDDLLGEIFGSFCIGK